MSEIINVTKSFLPPIEEYEAYLKRIWDANWLTNQGPLLKEFEAKTSSYIGIDGSQFHFVLNGTNALQLSLRSLEISDGEVITTPFSYVATTSSILWEHCTPVFVDILPDTFCIDPGKIEAAITPRTKAILPVHVFGNPCDVEAIEAIAKKHKLKVIYDGAHAFGVKYKGKSLLDHGDITICSFHATKPFHTIEGGAVITKDKKVSDQVELKKRFGHNGDEHYMLGINAKASEFHAAMGLCNLKYIDKITTERKKVSELYNQLLPESLRPNVQNRKDVEYNYAYYPVVVESEKKLLEIFKKLARQNIFPRRYFYPSLNTLDYVGSKQSCPISEDIALRIMCVPLYGGLEEPVVKKICEAIA